MTSIINTYIEDLNAEIEFVNDHFDLEYAAVEGDVYEIKIKNIQTSEFLYVEAFTKISEVISVILDAEEFRAKQFLKGLKNSPFS